MGARLPEIAPRLSRRGLFVVYGVLDKPARAPVREHRHVGGMADGSILAREFDATR
jgi:hypothetical protein